MKTWFKFYGQEFLTDPKMLSLTALERSLWLTILCLASASEEEGVIKYIDESKIKTMTNLYPLDDEWGMVDGFLEKFAGLGMIALGPKRIEVINFNKRQDTNLTGYERVKKYRAKKKVSNDNEPDDNDNVINDNVSDNMDDNVREEKNREEKNKETNTNVLVKKTSLNKSDLAYIDDEFMNHVAEMYQVPLSFVHSKFDDLTNWVSEKPTRAKGRDLRMTLKAWVKKDALERRDKAGAKLKYVGDAL